MEEPFRKALEEFFKMQCDLFPEAYCYHQRSHFEWVRDVVLKLGEMEGLSDSECDQLEVAALFHDIGYRFGYNDHEERSAALIAEFLNNYGANPSFIGEVEQLILSTNRKRVPRNLSDQIIRDADISYLGTDKYGKEAPLLREEVRVTRGLQFSDREWLELNLAFFRSQDFLTDSAQKLFGSMRKVNEMNVAQQLLSLNG